LEKAILLARQSLCSKNISANIKYHRKSADTDPLDWEDQKGLVDETKL
jgi:hypothetical protein